MAASGRHPQQRSREELVELLLTLQALAAQLAIDLKAGLSLPLAEQPARYREATAAAYRLTYLEEIEPAELDLELASAEPFAERSWQELYDLVWSVSWISLDLGQHLHFVTPELDVFLANVSLQENCALAWARAADMAAEIADYPLADLRDPDSVTPGVAYFGPLGLEGWTG